MLRRHSTLGDALVQQKKLDEGIAAHGEAIRLQPDASLYQFNLGYALRFRASSTKRSPLIAIDAFREAIRVKPGDAWAHFCLAGALLLQNKATRPSPLSARRFDSNRTAFYHVSLGNALERQGKFDLAIDAYREAIRLEPDRAFYHISLGQTLDCRKVRSGHRRLPHGHSTQTGRCLGAFLSR